MARFVKLTEIAAPSSRRNGEAIYVNPDLVSVVRRYPIVTDDKAGSTDLQTPTGLVCVAESVDEVVKLFSA